jgi:hypothetical protein
MRETIAWHSRSVFFCANNHRGREWNGSSRLMLFFDPAIDHPGLNERPDLTLEALRRLILRLTDKGRDRSCGLLLPPIAFANTVLCSS